MESTASDLDLIPQEKSPEPNYILIGIIVGVIVSFGIIGFMYYKNLPSHSKALNYLDQGAGANQFQIPFFNRIGTKTTIVTPTTVPIPEPTKQLQPTVTPVKVNTRQDLIDQQKALDITDMKEVLTDLEKNSKDSLQFSQ